VASLCNHYKQIIKARTEQSAKDTFYQAH